MVDNVRLPSAERTLDMVQLIAASNRGLTLSEISRALGIPKSSAHYLVQTLLKRGFLYRNIDGRTYSIGLRLPEFLNLSDPVRDLRNVLRKDLLAIARNIGLTAVATVLKGPEAVIVERVNSPNQESAGNWGNWIGRHIDVHCTAHGKIHLAYLAESELNGLLRERSLARFTPKTIWSIEDLRMHLARVRAEGFAVNDEEHIIGVRGVAAPIFSHVGSVIAAIGVTGSVKEMPRGQIPAMAKHLVSAAREVSRRFLDRFPANVWVVPQDYDA